MPPSHNLKILIVDATGSVVTNPEIVDYVYTHFVNITFRREVRWKHTKVPGCILWDVQTLSKIESQFMGDLFTTAIHSDDLLNKFTKHILYEIEQQTNRAFSCNIKIESHICRLLEEYMDRDYTFAEI